VGATHDATGAVGAANPDATPEALMAVGQMIFTNKSMQEGDVAAFVKLSTLMERRKAREFDEKKFQSSLKSKLEAGLDADHGISYRAAGAGCELGDLWGSAMGEDDSFAELWSLRDGVPILELGKLPSRW